MGFGLLFIGYILAFGLTSGTNYILALFGVIGAGFLYFAAKKLSLYTENFKTAKYTAVALSIAFVVNAVIQIIQKYIYTELDSRIIGAAGGFIAAVAFLYNFLMYKGIADIARTADNTKILSTSVFDMVLMAAYYMSVIGSKIAYPYFPNGSAIFGFSGMILGYVWLIATTVLLFTCYMRICREGEESMNDNKKGN